jgi:N-methylhydantoinase B
MLGGRDGAPHHYVMCPPGAAPVVLASKAEGIVVPARTTFEIHSGGGGGWGPPGERDPAARARDAVDGLVTGEVR